MPYSPRPRLSRRRQHSLQLQSDAQCWSILHPPTDDAIILAEFSDAAALAAELSELQVQREALALIDARRRVTAILIDPPAEVGLLVGLVDLPGVEAPFCQTMSIVIDDRVPTGAPSDEDRQGYHALRRAHMAQGLLLMDVLVTDGTIVRSLAIGCDPEPVWFDAFDPLDEP